MDRLAHFHFIIIFSSHRWSSASFCSACAPFPPCPPLAARAGTRRAAPRRSLSASRFSLSLPELIPTGGTGVEPLAHNESPMSREWNSPRRAKNCGTRNIIARHRPLPFGRPTVDNTASVPFPLPNFAGSRPGSRPFLRPLGAVLFSDRAPYRSDSESSRKY